MAACRSSMVASSTRKSVSCERTASFIVNPFSFFARERSGRSFLRCRQRRAEEGAPLQPGARTIARIAIEALHPLQDGEHARGAEIIAQAQRTARIAEAKLHGGVDVGRRSDALLRDVTADIDDAGGDALGDEAGAVADHGHG